MLTSNRLPSPNAKCRACVVSLELWPELVAKEPPAITMGSAILGVLGHPIIAPAGGIRDAAVQNSSVIASAVRFLSTRLVLLYSWQFTVVGDNNFRGLMQTIDVGLMGKVATRPPRIDRYGPYQGLDLQDRAGAPEQVLYRGPLVPFQLTRDTLGPYHSADQCRRATVETGAEDVSYAAAFEADDCLPRPILAWRKN